MEPAKSTGNWQGGAQGAAEHVAVEASRLVRIAKANDFPLLAYLLDMAVLEAWREAGERGGKPPAAAESHVAPESGA